MDTDQAKTLHEAEKVLRELGYNKVAGTIKDVLDEETDENWIAR